MKCPEHRLLGHGMVQLADENDHVPYKKCEACKAILQIPACSPPRHTESELLVPV